jgi:hypothetical protein
MTIEQLLHSYGPLTLVFTVFTSAGFLVSRTALWYVMSLMRPWHWRSAMELLGIGSSFGVLFSFFSSLALFNSDVGLVPIALAAFAGNMTVPLIVLICFLIGKISQITMTAIDDRLRHKFGSLTDEEKNQSK